MKNIHVLPTDKQSVLYKLNKFDDEFFLKRDLRNVLNPLYLFYNIYITSYSQDINENDYIITKDGKLVQVSYLLSEDLKGASKVILTTDQKLIHDDVQAIDKEFLEWFVKNPSREEILVGTEIWNDGKWNYFLPKQPDEQSTKERITMPGNSKTFRESVFDLLDRLLVNNMCSHQADWEIREFIIKNNLEPDGKV